MYILLYSIVISTLIFGVYQYFDSINRDTDLQPYDVTKDLLTVNNIMIYILILSIIFFIMYMAFNDESEIFSSLGIYDKDNGSYEIKKTNVNPYILKNTTDPMKMGFEPHNNNSGGSKSNSETDTSSVTSLESTVDSK
jgi:hypothetical protein